MNDTARSRSEIMSRIRGKDTKPELLMRKVLSARHWRFRVNHCCEGIKADIAFPRKKVALFIDGCFWHGCPKHSVEPRSNKEFWIKKITGNKRRDRMQNRKLRKAGWTVIRIWEHEVETAPLKAAVRIVKVLEGKKVPFDRSIVKDAQAIPRSSKKHSKGRVIDSTKGFNDVQVENLIRKKLKRVKEGGPLRTLDLFAGCGGLSLGLHAAGFQVVGAVELDPPAAATFSLNFSPLLQDLNPSALGQPRDIRMLNPADAIDSYGIRSLDIHNAIDVLVGGPPCQAFARIGRAKLREVVDHPQAYKIDERASLYHRYIDYVRQLRPIALLMENVPEVLNFGGRNISQEVCDVLGDLGYVCTYTLLNAVYYGVPQFRERMFLVAVHQDCGSSFNFPAPTHRANLPVGYLGTRSHAIGSLSDVFKGGNKESSCNLVPYPKHDGALLPAVTTEQAIADLPPIESLRLEATNGWARYRLLTAVRLRAATSMYQRMIRSWQSFESNGVVYDHTIRHLPRDHRLFARMTPGMEYPEVHELAAEIFENEELPRLKRTGVKIPSPGTKEFLSFRARWVPPYDVGKFPNKWWMLFPDQPSRTLTAHLGKDGYTHIHYDPQQARTISVREAARLQSFPDGFKFAGKSMNAAFRQIGNAVPPLLAMSLGRSIRNALGITDYNDLSRVK